MPHTQLSLQTFLGLTIPNGSVLVMKLYYNSNSDNT
jgi:hypothetical protein